MVNLFSGLFRKSKMPYKNHPPSVLQDFSQYDTAEYIMYCIEQEQKVSWLEAELHTSDDPKEIAMQTLEVACAFYGGDWAGIIEVDLEMDVWNPLWCFNMNKRDKLHQPFGEFEVAKFMPNWVRSLKEGKPIIIHNAKDVQKEHPEEYAVYKRLEVDSVIGVPFGPNPVGFLAIRNPSRYVSHSSMMSILAYVLHRAMAQQKTIDSAKLAMSPDEIQSDRDIIINFFGSMEIHTSQGVLKERDFNSPKSSRVATYLLLNRKSSHTAWEIVEELWPEEPDKMDALCNYIRGYIHTFRKAFALVSPYPLIVTAASGYQINHDFHIMTDLQQFDLLWEKAQHATSVSHKAELLKKAVDLYKGHVFENACDEHWIVGTVTQYKSRYIGIVNELLATLMEVGDYSGVQHYATKAKKITPENVKAYYWLVCAMTKLDCSELAKNEIAHAKKGLTSEEFASLKKMLLSDKPLSDELLREAE